MKVIRLHCTQHFCYYFFCLFWGWQLQLKSLIRLFSSHPHWSQFEGWGCSMTTYKLLLFIRIKHKWQSGTQFLLTFTESQAPWCLFCLWKFHSVFKGHVFAEKQSFRVYFSSPKNISTCKGKEEKITSQTLYLSYVSKRFLSWVLTS